MEKKIKRWLYENFYANIENKIIVITGANSGIGYYVSYLCAYYKANIIMAVRSLERGEKAKNKIFLLFLKLGTFWAVLLG
jgi:NADP-dependent 3-hydroxy acid dehydrogenase YdfG